MLAFFTSPWNVCRPPQSNEFGNVELNKDKSFFFLTKEFLKALRILVYTTNLYARPGMRFPNRSHHERFCSESQGTGESWNIL